MILISFTMLFDLFVLPSLFEGLGIVAIEAEANGCNTFLSTSVPQEAIISQNVEHIPLNINQWVEKSIFLIKKLHHKSKKGFHAQNSRIQYKHGVIQARKYLY